MPSFTPTVVAAARPFNRRETEMGTESHCVANADERTRVSFRHPLTGYAVNFDFDRFYNLTSIPLTEVTHSMNLGNRIVRAGYGCYVALGSLGSGKSYCAMGNKQDAPGIIPCWLAEIFKYCIDPTIRITMSAFEVLANETLVDLLAFGEWALVNGVMQDREAMNQGTFLTLREKAMAHSTVQVTDTHQIVGHVQQPIQNIEDFHRVQSMAERFRELNIESGPINPQLYLVEVTQQGEPLTKIMLVDLMWHPDAGDRFKLIQRAVNNDSVARGLLALEDVVYSLLTGRRDPGPKLESYRSILTRVLWPFLTGGPCVILGTFSPSTLEFESSLTTLQYLFRCKQGNRPTQSQIHSKAIPPLQPLSTQSGTSTTSTTSVVKQNTIATTTQQGRSTDTPSTQPDDSSSESKEVAEEREKEEKEDQTDETTLVATPPIEECAATPPPGSDTSQPLPPPQQSTSRTPINPSPVVAGCPQVQGAGNNTTAVTTTPTSPKKDSPTPSSSQMQQSPPPPGQQQQQRPATVFPSSLPPPPTLPSFFGAPPGAFSPVVGGGYNKGCTPPAELGSIISGGGGGGASSVGGTSSVGGGSNLRTRIEQLEAELQEMKQQVVNQPQQAHQSNSTTPTTTAARVPTPSQTLASTSTSILDSFANGQANPNFPHPSAAVSGLNRRLSDPWYSTGFARPSSGYYNMHRASPPMGQAATAGGGHGLGTSFGSHMFNRHTSPGVKYNPYYGANLGNSASNLYNNMH